MARQYEFCVTAFCKLMGVVKGLLEWHMFFIFSREQGRILKSDKLKLLKSLYSLKVAVCLFEFVSLKR